MSNKNQLISIIIPTFKGENTIEMLIKEIVKVCQDVNFEIVVVNDSSPDASNEILLDLYNSYKNIITYVKLKKNSGEFNAVMAGLRNCKGEFAITVDDDLQHPPDEVYKLIEHSMVSENDVTYTEFKKYNYSYTRNLLSKFYNFTANILLNKPKHIYLSSLKSIRRNIIDEITKYKGNYAYIDALIFTSTNKIGTFLVNHQSRKMGKSGYTLKKFAEHYGNLLFNFSTMPFKLIFNFGLFLSLALFINLILIYFNIIKFKSFQIEDSILISSIIFLAGIQILFINFIKEKLLKYFKVDKITNQYIVEFVKENKKKKIKSNP
tara:strand:- start:1249 stop:2211 length:963 start_codon:yes stop_codon:yes gene_type:complete